MNNGWSKAEATRVARWFLFNNLGKFWRAFDWKMLIYFKAI
jgi:hypothetical protein